MKRLKIALQFNSLYYVLLIISLLQVFIRINYFPYKSYIDINSSFKGIITSINNDNEKYKLSIKNKEEVIGYYKVDKEIDINLGDEVLIEGIFSEPQNNTIPNTFNYKKYLNNHKIFYQVNIKKIDVIKKNNNLLYSIKNYLLKRIDSFGNKGYFKAFIIGDKTELDNYQLFQNNGVSHLFAISGMHIGLLTSLLYFILRKSKYQNIIIISFLSLYLNITNYSASLIRSYLFFMLLLLNKKYDLKINTKNILLLTINILLIYNPYFIYDYGFLYSVVTTYGLIMSSKYYSKNYVYNLFITSLMAFLFSMPITLYMNYEINILSIISNLIVVPLVSLIVYPFSLITFIFNFLEPIFSFMIFILEKINYFLNIIGFYIVVPKVNVTFYLIYYVLLIIFIKSNNVKYLLIGILLIISLKIKPFVNREKAIYYLDVGQGDSTVIINKSIGLIDTGGLKNRKIYDNIIRFIKSLGYNHLDFLIITHGDYDHMGEAINLVNNLKVEKVIFNCGEYQTLEKELIKVLEKKKIKYFSCIKELNIDKNKLYFLQTKEYDNENDNSNVIYTELDGYKFMFMGDASATTEKEILNKYNLPDMDVLKVGHHGSKTSSSNEFINEINPKYSIISVGKNNRYGHPNKEVLENLENSKIYRTDQDGSIMFKIKNNKLKIEACSP